MRIENIVKAISLIFRYFALVILLPCVISICYKEYWSAIPFIITSLISFILSFGDHFTKKSDLNNLKRVEALCIAIYVWVSAVLISAVPYLFFGLTPINAIFEATSGITTTGATVLTDFSIYPRAMFFWRSFSQWLGGMGIIVLFIAILPQFAIAGRQMFFAEASNTTEDKVTPRIKETAAALWKLYAGLTIFETLLLLYHKMPIFDAICNSMSTLAGGGFSPNPYSITNYTPAIVWIMIVFMFFSGVNFTLQYKVVAQRKVFSFFCDEEFRAYFFTILAFSVCLTVLLFQNNMLNISDAFRESLFQVISIITTAGFASSDYATWDLKAKLLLFILMFTGASVGSASGGLKIIRLLFIGKYLKRNIQQIHHPNGVYPIKFNKKVVPDSVITQIIAFAMFYYLIFVLSAIAITIFENSLSTGVTGSIATLGNVGPAFGALGPMGNYASLSHPTKLILIFNMLVGRLELIPFLAMLHPDFWKFKNESIYNLPKTTKI